MSEKREGLMFSDDPNTILSYGNLARQIIENTYDKIEWRLISKQIQHMIPEKWVGYTRYPAGSSEEEFNTEILPDMIKQFNPEFFLSLGDVQYFKMTRFFIKKNVPWIHYLPIDNRDLNNLGMNMWTIQQMDIPVCMSKFARDLCIENGMEHCDKYIYPMVKTKATPAERLAVEKKQLGWTNIDLGYRKITEKDGKNFDLINDYKYKELKIPEDATTLLFVGRPGWRKNVQFIISILRKLLQERKRKVVLYMHTDVSDPASTVNILKELYAHQIPESAFYKTKNMKWWKGVHPTALEAIYNIADIQIAPHGGEGFGIPLAEGLACELPFVATDCTTTPELSGNGKWSLGAKVKDHFPDMGVVRPFVDLDDFCDKVEYLIDNPSERKRMGRMGRIWVERHLNPKRITKKWMKVFDLTQVDKIRPVVDQFGKAILTDVK